MKSVLHHLAIASCFYALGCGGEAGPGSPERTGCVSVTGQGKTMGNANLLTGGGRFSVGSVESDVEVGLYLFQRIPDPEGGIRVKTQYQFLWENGDTFLTADWVNFEPTLRPDEFTFNVDMTVASGSGIFRNSVGKKPISLTATIIFTDPENPADPPAAEEHFDLSGSVCN